MAAISIVSPSEIRSLARCKAKQTTRLQSIGWRLTYNDLPKILLPVSRGGAGKIAGVSAAIYEAVYWTRDEAIERAAEMAQIAWERAEVLHKNYSHYSSCSSVNKAYYSLYISPTITMFSNVYRALHRRFGYGQRLDLEGTGMIQGLCAASARRFFSRPLREQRSLVRRVTTENEKQLAIDEHAAEALRLIMSVSTDGLRE